MGSLRFQLTALRAFKTLFAATVFLLNCADANILPR